MYYNLLAKIRNAALAKKDTLVVPFSNFDYNVAKLLAERGYLKDVQKKTSGNKKFIEIKLSYKNSSPSISGFKIISRPSRHVYLRKDKVRRVRQGYGTGVISTTEGILSDGDARKKRVGGEYLFEIW